MTMETTATIEFLQLPHADGLPPPAYPSYFSVSINDQVARSLGFILPPEADLEKRLEGRN